MYYGGRQGSNVLRCFMLTLLFQPCFCLAQTFTLLRQVVAQLCPSVHRFSSEKVRIFSVTIAFQDAIDLVWLTNNHQSEDTLLQIDFRDDTEDKCSLNDKK